MIPTQKIRRLHIRKINRLPADRFHRRQKECRGKCSSVAWNELHARYTLHRINHEQAYSLGGPDEINTNNAESFFSRMRRGEIGHHHHVAGPYLIRFAQEAAWREDHRKEPNGFQVDRLVGLAMHNKPSIDFCGYWQRS